MEYIRLVARNAKQWSPIGEHTYLVYETSDSSVVWTFSGYPDLFDPKRLVSRLYTQQDFDPYDLYPNSAARKDIVLFSGEDLSDIWSNAVPEVNDYINRHHLVYDTYAQNSNSAVRAAVVAMGADISPEVLFQGVFGAGRPPLISPLFMLGIRPATGCPLGTTTCKYRLGGKSGPDASLFGR
ncbi:MAG: hypothetical protein ABL962_04265 [Fimbriimonadaceae bacterium]